MVIFDGIPADEDPVVLWLVPSCVLVGDEAVVVVVRD